jgi:anti-sigma regulatory factor (Ser/Thr protein kinase)
MSVAARAADDAFEICRGGSNLWWLWFGSSGAFEPLLSVLGSSSLPSSALGQSPGMGPAGTLAKVELDSCGAWITLANSEAARPVVVRRAGWVDVRGHPFASDQKLCDDRIGLGPGDAIVMARRTGPGGAEATDYAFLDRLLSVAGQEPGRIAAAAAPSPEDGIDTVALAVPEDLGSDPRQRVARATGVPAEELDLPGYPLGDLQPELWALPPSPPRLARLRLEPDATSVRGVRSLLDRLLASWRLDNRVDPEEVKLVASELATNAVRHTGRPETATVMYSGSAVRVEVDDGSPILPEYRQAGPEDVSGRGLLLVDALADKWGVESRPDGKRVWCEIAVGGDASSPPIS